jgi:hypothetical protein
MAAAPANSLLAQLQLEQFGEWRVGRRPVALLFGGRNQTNLRTRLAIAVAAFARRTEAAATSLAIAASLALLAGELAAAFRSITPLLARPAVAPPGPTFIAAGRSTLYLGRRR